MADGTVCDGGSRGSTPANGKSEREGEGYGDADGAKGKRADGKGTVDNDTSDRPLGIPKGWGAYGVLCFHPIINADKEAINDLNLQYGHVGGEGLIYLRCMRCKRRDLGALEICAMGVCDGCHHRLCCCWQPSRQCGRRPLRTA